MHQELNYWRNWRAVADLAKSDAATARVIAAYCPNTDPHISNLMRSHSECYLAGVGPEPPPCKETARKIVQAIEPKNLHQQEMERVRAIIRSVKTNGIDASGQQHPGDIHHLGEHFDVLRGNALDKH